MQVSIIDAFAGQKVLVIGDAMLDRYSAGPADRLSREAPVPVETLANHDDVPGGAANIAANLARLGAKVRFLSVVGDDREGDLLCSILEEQGVSTADVAIQPGRNTLTNHLALDGDHLLARFDQDSAELIDSLTEEILLGRLA